MSHAVTQCKIGVELCDIRHTGTLALLATRTESSICDGGWKTGWSRSSKGGIRDASLFQFLFINFMSIMPDSRCDREGSEWAFAPKRIECEEEEWGCGKRRWENFRTRIVHVHDQINYSIEDTQDAHDNHAYDSTDDDDYLQVLLSWLSKLRYKFLMKNITIKDGLEIVPPLEESLLASDHLHLQMMKKRESVASILSTYEHFFHMYFLFRATKSSNVTTNHSVNCRSSMSNERERWRMEQMTSRRSSKDILLRMNELYKDSERWVFYFFLFILIICLKLKWKLDNIKW